MDRKNFAQRLASARQSLARGEARGDAHAPAAHSLAIGWRLAMELLATMAVGGFCGWWLDQWLGTAPIFLLTLIFLGSAAGIWSVYRQSRAMAAERDGRAENDETERHHG